jgi:hypothetical protein
MDMEITFVPNDNCDMTFNFATAETTFAQQKRAVAVTAPLLLS